MTDILIQFHATQEELLSFTDDFVREFGLHVTALEFPPFSARRVEPTAVEESFGNRTVFRFAFTRSPPVLGAKALGLFLDENPGALMLEIGRLSDTGLNESCLTARTFDPDELQLWKKIAARLKKMSVAGAIATNPQTGASSKSNLRRCTPGAKALQARGVPMLPVAGSAVIRYVD